MQPLSPSASVYPAARSSFVLPKRCPTCILCEGPLFDRRPVVVTDCRHRFHYDCMNVQSVDWQLADRRCSACNAWATGVIKSSDEQYGSADLRSKLAVIEACFDGDYDAVVSAVMANPDLAHTSIRSGKYETLQFLIHAAADRGQVSIVNFLLDRGADINQQDFQGSSPLLMAVEGNFVELVALLLDRGAEGLHDAFLKAAFKGQVDMLRELVNRGAEVDRVYTFDSNHIDGVHEFTALAIGLAQTSQEVSNQMALEMAEFLISKGARASVEALWMATGTGRLEAVKFLIAKGVDVNGMCGRPLYAAVLNNRIELVNALLEGGAMTDTSEDGESPIHCAAEKGRLDILNRLINAGASVNPFVAADGITTHSPLYAAVRAGHEVVARVLIERGAGVDIADRSGYTPLVGAILAKNSALFRLLLDSGADVNALNGLAMKTAIVLRDCQAVELLIEKGSDVFAALDTGETPLALANRLNRTDEARVIAAAASNAVIYE